MDGSQDAPEDVVDDQGHEKEAAPEQKADAEHQVSRAHALPPEPNVRPLDGLPQAPQERFDEAGRAGVDAVSGPHLVHDVAERDSEVLVGEADRTAAPV